jgi:hypothetical protein
LLVGVTADSSDSTNTSGWGNFKVSGSIVFGPGGFSKLLHIVGPELFRNIRSYNLATIPDGRRVGGPTSPL